MITIIVAPESLKVSREPNSSSVVVSLRDEAEVKIFLNELDAKAVENILNEIYAAKLESIGEL